MIIKSLSSLGYTVTKNADALNLLAYSKLTKEILEKRPFYNVGSGSFKHPYWKNIDYVSDWYKDVQSDVIHHDLMSKQSLPIKSGEAKIIYTSHTIEHIEEHAVQFFFYDAFRALEKNGIFRVTTGPDAETDFRALINNDNDWFYWDSWYSKKGSFEHIYTAPATSVSLAERWLHHFASPLSKIDKSPSEIKFSEEEIWKIINQAGFPKALDYFSSYVQFNPERTGNHVSWWTHEKIIDLLKKVGFSKVYRSGYNQSVSPLMRNSSLFDTTHPQMSIYVEAIK